MNSTRTVVIVLLASTLLVIPAEAGWKSRLLKGAAVGVGGYIASSLGGEAAEASQSDMLHQPDSVLRVDELDGLRQIVERTIETAWDLLQYRGIGSACQATEEYQEEFYLFENTDAVFAGDWHKCCALPSGKVLQSSVLALQQLPFLGGMKAPDAAEDAVSAFADEVLEYSEMLDNIYDLGRNSGAIDACRSVMSKDMAIP